MWQILNVTELLIYECILKKKSWILAFHKKYKILYWSTNMMPLKSALQTYQTIEKLGYPGFVVDMSYIEKIRPDLGEDLDILQWC